MWANTCWGLLTLAAACGLAVLGLGSQYASLTPYLLTAAGVFGVASAICFARPLWAYSRTRFRLEFVASRDIIRNVTQFDMRTGQQLPNKATYVHVRVECTGSSDVTACVGWLTKLEKLDVNQTVIASLDEARPLIWAPRESGHTSVPIHQNAPRDLDVFRTQQKVDRLELLSYGHPAAWHTFVDQPGLYRLTISVSGDGRSRIIHLLVSWRGHADDFDIEVDRS